MPYIQEADREMFMDLLHEIDQHKIETPGELNYLITNLIVRYLQVNGLSYQNCNDILGALDGASKEFYRRVVAPYEHDKIKINGDVYPDDFPTPSEAGK